MELKQWLFILWVFSVKNALAGIFYQGNTPSVASLSLTSYFVDEKFDLDITQHFSLLGHNLISSVDYAAGMSDDLIIQTNAGQLIVTDDVPGINPPSGYSQVIVFWQINPELRVPIYRRYFRHAKKRKGMLKESITEASLMSASQEVVVNQISGVSGGATPIFSLAKSTVANRFTYYSLGELMSIFMTMEDYKKIKSCLYNQKTLFLPFCELDSDIQTAFDKLFQLIGNLNLTPCSLIQFIARIFIPREAEGDKRQMVEAIIRAFYSDWKQTQPSE